MQVDQHVKIAIVACFWKPDAKNQPGNDSKLLSVDSSAVAGIWALLLPVSVHGYGLPF